MGQFGRRMLALIAAYLWIAAPAAAQPKPEVELTAASYVPETHVAHRSLAAYLQEIQKASDGRIATSFHPNGSLVAQGDMLQAGRSGTVDIVTLATSVFPGEFRFSADAGTLLFLWDIGNFDKALKVLRPLLEAELRTQNLKYLWLAGTVTQWFMRKPTDLDDPSWKGRKVRGYGGASNRLIDMLGGSNVAVSNNELPMAASTGVLDGLGTSLGSFAAWGIEKQLPCMLVTNDVPLITVIAINLDTWNKISAPLQKIMSDAAATVEATYIQTLRDEERPAEARFAATSGCVQHFSAAQRDAWQTRLALLYDDFRKKQGAKGIKFIGDVLAAIKE